MTKYAVAVYDPENEQLGLFLSETGKKDTIRQDLVERLGLEPELEEGEEADVDWAEILSDNNILYEILEIK